VLRAHTSISLYRLADKFFIFSIPSAFDEPAHHKPCTCANSKLENFHAYTCQKRTLTDKYQRNLLHNFITYDKSIASQPLQGRVTNQKGTAHEHKPLHKLHKLQSVNSRGHLLTITIFTHTPLVVMFIIVPSRLQAPFHTQIPVGYVIFHDLIAKIYTTI
jgi:hypothetical protein